MRLVFVPIGIWGLRIKWGIMCRNKDHGGRRCEKTPEQHKAYNENRRIEYANKVYDEHLRTALTIVDEHRAAGKETHKLYAKEIGPGQFQWKLKRLREQNQIIDELLLKYEHVPSNKHAIMSGGLGGAGKSTVLGKFANIDTSQYATVNPDDIKEIMAEKGLVPKIPHLSPMESSPLVHEEASDISKRLAFELMRLGKNVIYDITMSSKGSTQSKIESLKRNGYTVEGIFVDIEPETSIDRAAIRHRHGYDAYKEGIGFGGRILPTAITLAQKPDENSTSWSKNRDIFNDLASNETTFSRARVYDNNTNNVDPKLVSDSEILTVD